MKAPSITSLALSAVVFLEFSKPAQADPAIALDPSFTPAVNGNVAAILVGANDTVLIGGDFNAVNGSSRTGLARLQASGELDSTFNSQTDAPVAVLEPMPGGRVAVGGRFNHVNGELAPNLAVLSTAGEVVDGWSGVSGAVACASANESGALVAGGSIQSVLGQDRLYTARFDANGLLDAGWIPGLERSFAIEAGVTAAALQPDGKTIVAGVFGTSSGPESLGRLNADGTHDPSYSGDCGSILYANALLALPDGRVLVGGLDRNGKGFVRRLNADRSIDASFSAPEFDGPVNALALDARGRVLAGGAFRSPVGVVARLNTNGALDAQWTPGLEGAANALAVDSRKRVLVGGFLRSGASHTGLVRLLDGTSVNPLSTNDGTFRAALRAVAGRTYAVEASADLASWTVISTAVADENGVQVTDGESSGRRHRFFRARLIQ